MYVPQDIHFDFDIRSPIEPKMFNDSFDAMQQIAVRMDGMDTRPPAQSLGCLMLSAALSKHSGYVGRDEFLSMAARIWDAIQGPTVN